MSDVVQQKPVATGLAAGVETPLHYYHGTASGGDKTAVLLREAPLMGHLNLRGSPANELFLKGVADVLGLSVPTEPCTCAGNDKTTVYWLGPTEWLVIVAGGTEAELEVKLRQVLHGHFSIVDISGGQTLINLSGAGVDAVLKKSSVYDFHPSHFGPGRCVQTTFAKATALISKKADGSFDLVIRRSFADYLFRWIADAAAEYGFAVKNIT